MQETVEEAMAVEETAEVEALAVEETVEEAMAVQETVEVEALVVQETTEVVIHRMCVLVPPLTSKAATFTIRRTSAH